MENRKIESGGYTGDFYYVERHGRKMVAYDYNTKLPVGGVGIAYQTMKKSAERGLLIGKHVNAKGKASYRICDMALAKTTAKVHSPKKVENAITAPPMDSIANLIHTESLTKKPHGLKLGDLKWKHLIRSVVRGKNILMRGESGTGKTFTAKCVADALDRPLFVFNLGATQDPRSTLIGNTHFDNDRGTFFSESEFIRAIKTPNAVVLLDELSRAHVDASNILMTALDDGQRYIRIDEDKNTPTVMVADGVSFIATANLGSKYTGAGFIDRALSDRFVIVEMDMLGVEEEAQLLQQRYPTVDYTIIMQMAEIACSTRDEFMKEDGSLSDYISTRVNVEAVGMIADMFTLAEVAEVMYYPYFSDDGGVKSERTFVRQMVQKHLPAHASGNLHRSAKNMI